MIGFLILQSVVFGDVQYPSGSGIINVKTDHGAIGNGIADDTVEIQAAITAAMSSKQILYFPNGTYLVSDTLTYPGNSKRVTLQGQSESGVIIKLTDNASGFGSGADKPVFNMTTSSSTGQAFRNQIFDMTVDVGSGNPGAIGIRFISNNQGGMRNVTIRSSDPNYAGSRGLDLTAQWPGPSYFKNLTIDGFDTGVFCTNREYSNVFENLTLNNQQVRGIFNRDNIMTIRGLISNSSHNVILNRSSNANNSWGMISLIGATFTGQTGASSVDAIKNESGTLYARNISATGYGKLITNLKGTMEDITALSVDEYVSHAPVSAFSGAAEGSLKLPIEEAPTFNDTNLSHWIPVNGSASDDGPAIQAAIDSATSTNSTVYLPFGDYSVDTPVIIRGHVRRIIGLGGRINIQSTLRASSNAAFTFASMSHSDPVIVENIASNFNGGTFDFFRHQSSNIVVLRNVFVQNQAGGGAAFVGSATAGKLFLEDVASYRGWEFNGQQVWARNFNVENYNNVPQITNQNGDVWILGLKTEQARTLVDNSSGGRVEVLGGLGYPIATVGSLPAFKSVDGDISVIFGFSNYIGGQFYDTIVEETRSGSTVLTDYTNFPTRTFGNAVAVPLYVGFSDSGDPGDNGIIAYDGFSDADYTDGASVIGINGGSGWAGPWETSGSGKAVSPGMEFTELTEYGNLKLNASAGSKECIRRILPATDPKFGAASETIWVSYLSAATGYGSQDGILKNGSGSGSVLQVTASNNNTFKLVSGSTVVDTGFAVGDRLNKPRLVILKIEFTAGNESVSLWVGDSGTMDLSSEASLGAPQATLN
ncbi:MAG: glycosyl hydrolase family 28-related protein, partial [Verrucomicrobiota bacterium]